MKRLTSIPIQKKITFYFILAVIIPSILMGALAFRGIKNDQALREKENRRQAHIYCNQIISFIKSDLKSLQERTKKIVFYRPEMEDEFISDTVLAIFVESDSTIQALFHISSGKVKMLNSGLIYRPNGANTDQRHNEIDASSNWDKGWIFEFKEKNIKKAVSYYENQLSVVTEDNLKALVLNNIARLYKKQRNYQKAIATYLELEEYFGDIRLNTRFPISFITKLELSALYLGQKDTLSALRAIKQLELELITDKYHLAESEFIFFENKIENILANLSSQVRQNHNDLLLSLDDLSSVRKIRKERTKELLLLKQYIEDKEKDILEQQGNQFIHKIGGREFMISVCERHKDDLWVIAFSLEDFIETKIVPLIKAASQETKWHWSLLDDRDQFLTSGTELRENAYLETITFPSDFPSWKLQASIQPQDIFQTFMQAEGSLYFYLFFFIGAVLIAGFLFLYYSFIREMQIHKLKSDFVSTVSHEFKTPLTAIQQITEMLKRNRVPAEKRDKYYSVLLQEARKLSQLIDNILDFSRIEQGKSNYSFKVADLRALAKETVGRYREKLTGKGFQINLDLEAGKLEARIDPQAIEQVFNNLIDNAIKYSDNSTRIDISSFRDEHHIITSVKDYGIGISKEEQTRIFEKFYRTDEGSARGIKGSGIGLALVKEIIDAHKGTILLKSKAGEGSEFLFKIPALDHIHS